MVSTLRESRPRKRDDEGFITEEKQLSDGVMSFKIMVWGDPGQQLSPWHDSTGAVGHRTQAYIGLSAPCPLGRWHLKPDVTTGECVPPRVSKPKERKAHLENKAFKAGLINSK